MMGGAAAPLMAAPEKSLQIEEGEAMGEPIMADAHHPVSLASVSG